MKNRLFNIQNHKDQKILVNYLDFENESSLIGEVVLIYKIL